MSEYLDPMTPAPAYSIVLPAFNAQATMGRAIESVLAQSFPSWELLVIDDGSTDRTAAIASEYASSDMRVQVMCQPNGGTAAARNAGISSARSTMVAFLDADDEMMPDYLTRMNDFMCSNPDYDIYHPNLVVRSEYGDALYMAGTKVASFGLDDLLTSCVIPAGGALMRRDLLTRLAGFRTDIHCEDYDFALRAIASGARALYLPVPLYIYHQEHQAHRSQDDLAGAIDLERSLQDLIDSGVVETSRVPSIIEAARRAHNEQARAPEQGEMRAQVQTLRASLERVLGTRLTSLAMRSLYRVRWIVRPLRRAMARRARRP